MTPTETAPVETVETSEAPRRQVSEVVLVLADISGYTRFAAANRTALEHSQHLIVELIEAVIREAQIPLEVAKLEGDAVFLYAVRRDDTWEGTRARIGERLLTFFQAFSTRLAELARTLTCNCAMCANVDHLRLKVVVHSGQALFVEIGRFEELLGVDVIVAHRLLKNSVEADEYLLVTEPAVEALELPAAAGAAHTESLDAVGDVRVTVYDPVRLNGRWDGPVPAASAQLEPAEREIRKLSRRSFAWAGVTVLSGFGLQQWFASREGDNGIPWPLRRVLEVNERLARDYFGLQRLAPTFPRSMAREPRANGEEGLGEDFDPAQWRLHIEGLWGSGRGDTLELTLAAIQALPKVEMVTEFKCIEGWSEIVHWGGARLADLIAKHPPLTRSGEKPDVARRPHDLAEYVAMETPDGGYYVGIDMASALHPQTLLGYEMNGEALPLEHGAPLRLVIPVKYGVKNIKRIGTIRFTNQRPADYWAERGYDWYAGH